MKTKMLLASAILSLASGLASADDFYLNAGAITQDVLNPYGHIFVHEAGTFTDTIDFTIPFGSLGASANPLSVMLDGVSVHSIINLAYTVYGGTAASGNSINYGTFLGDNTSNDIMVPLGGAYHIIVTGLANQNNGGAYGIALVSGVPEPETYAMMLGGIALIGVAARRRQRRG